MGVILWQQIEFPDLRIKLSSDVTSGDYLVDADITVTYAVSQPGTFDVKLKDLPVNVQQALDNAIGQKAGGAANAGIKIVIHLGYLDEPGSKAVVLQGRVDAIQATTRFRPLATRLTGHEEAAFKLLNTRSLYGETPAPDTIHLTEPRSDGSATPLTPAALAQQILTAAGVGVDGQPAPTDPITGQVHLVAADGFELLNAVARAYGAEILVQDGVAQFGQAVQSPAPTGGLPVPPNPAALLALVTGDDSLITVNDLNAVGMAAFTPVQIGNTSRQQLVTDLPSTADVGAFDFTVLGRPGLRAGQMVVASLQGYQNPLSPFRVLTITHSFSPQSGYVCTGRAVTFTPGAGNRTVSDLARQGSPRAISDLISGKIRDSATTFPSIDVGKVTAAKPDQRVATVVYGQDSASTAASPSVDLDIPEGQRVLLGKPVLSPFAWHKVGLSVPLYQGMRAMLSEVRDARGDAIVTGFMWANQPKMDRPAAEDGDWWLCLPTEVAGSPPLPSGKGANDLIGADGRRTIEAVGLKVNVGKSSCSDVGQRPDDADAEVFLISHASGTTVQIDSNGKVTVDGGGQSITLKAGGVTLTVGQGKVAIS